MPARTEIQKEILQAADLVRRRYLASVNKHTGRDTILYATAFTSPKRGNIPPPALSINQQDIQGFMASLHELKGDKLDLILHSPGGSLEAAEQVVGYLRSKYAHIRAIVPQSAMSAATMIACACDEIILGKQSCIGPIDPQLTITTAAGSNTAAAQSIIDEFEQAKREVSADPKLAALWAVKIKDYPPGLLNRCAISLQMSREKVATWLRDYMFKDPSAETKCVEIADWLADVKTHKAHGRPIGIAEAQSRGLKVATLEDDNTFQDLVLSVFHAASVTFDSTPCVKLIENHIGKGWFVNIKQPNG